MTAENPDALPINLDHLYGHVNDTANSVVYDFVDIQAQANIHNESANVLEDLSLRLAFVNGGIGGG